MERTDDAATTPRLGSALLTSAVGLHARPSVKLTQVAKRFASNVEFSLDPAGPWADAKSPVRVMRVRAAKGSTLYFRVTGADADEALSTLIALVEHQFEEAADALAARNGNDRQYRGRAAAPGIAVGPLVVIREHLGERVGTGDVVMEAAALRAAIAMAIGELRALAHGATGDATDILGFQIAFLEDPELADRAFAGIAAGGSAHECWLDTLSAEAVAYESSNDEYFRTRNADVCDIRDRVLAHLMGAPAATAVPPGAIVAAVDLAPSRFLSIDWTRGGALALTGGSPMSHVAMLARARGVPAVVGLDVPLTELRGNALVHGNRGLLILDPTAQDRATFATEARAAIADRAATDELARDPARTIDGTAIRVLLNISTEHELDGLDPAICDGIGLVRTELLFHDGMPEENEQYRVYRRIAEWAEGRPVVIRTLDAGADKPLPGLRRDVESNPALGLRGLRLSFAFPDAFRAQIRAIVRASMHGDVRMMLPMVTSPAELEWVRAMLDDEVAQLRREGTPATRPSLGIMVEVPAAAIAADQFETEFFSIGSNDLAQYVAAAGRDVRALTELASPTQPAVLRLIGYVVSVAARRGLEVSLCGDAGGDPAAIPQLLGAGLRALSVAPALVGRTKRAITATDLREVDDASRWPE